MVDYHRGGQRGEPPDTITGYSNEKRGREYIIVVAHVFPIRERERENVASAGNKREQRASLLDSANRTITHFIINTAAKLN